MIVPMKKVIMLCLRSMQRETLDKLAELGVMHVEAEKLADSHDRTELEQLNNNAGRISNMLKGIESPHVDGEVIEDGAAVFKKTAALFDERDKIAKRLDQLFREEEQLRPWGDFSQKDLHEMRSKGVFVYLCAATKNIYEEYAAKDDILVEVIEESKTVVNFVIVSKTQLEEAELPLASIPSHISLSEVEEKIVRYQQRDDEAVAELAKLKASAPALEKYIEQVASDLEFATVRDGMDDHGVVICLTGYVPVPEVAKLEKYADEHGWGLSIEDPDPGQDQIPTLLKVPKMFRIAKPIFEFIGVLPGYYEQDVSVCFLFFFTIFFGMIVGDAGYGLLFLITAAILKYKFRDSQKVKLQLNLFIVLSLATFIWGALGGNYFGIPNNKLPEFMRGIDALTNPAVKDKNVQWLCFFIAAVHLSIGRGWQALLHMRTRKGLGEIGWGMLIWANFLTATELIVFPGSFPKILGTVLYVGGIVLILGFGVNYKEIGEVFNLPFGFIGSFVDVLSYIRLFAVGMSTYYIASSFNNMAGMLMNIPAPALLVPLLILCGVIVIIFGHALNIALAFMGVLVHGIRLNTLEFSNHMGLGWAGQMYKPFKKNNRENSQTTQGEKNND